jgi:dTDP-4-amino-4,6-dideoxygalactose transaminase
MASYTFVSTANAFVLLRRKNRVRDIRPDTMNMDETLIEAASHLNLCHRAGALCRRGLQ